VGRKILVHRSGAVVLKTKKQSLRIIHACNLYFNRDGTRFDSMDARIQMGLTENGYYVHPFSIHDMARQLSWRCDKKAGAKRANQALIEICKNINPDILLLGHSQSITYQTLEIIRKNQPNIKIAQWFCDWFYSKQREKFQFIYDRLPLLDAFFGTTSGDKINSFAQQGCRATYFPNMTHLGIEKYQSFNQKKHEYDLIFMGVDKRDPIRHQLLLELKAQLGTRFKFGIFGSLGEARIYGPKKERILASSKAALNLTRLPEQMKWYSSDRIASLLGNGLLTCTQTDPDLHELYGKDAMIYYSSTQDLIAQLENALISDQWRKTAKKGWEITHELFNAKRITSLMIEFIYNQRDDCLNLF